MPTYTIAEETELLAEAGLLTERQAEAFVRRRVEAEPGFAVADAMGIGESAVSDYVADAEAKLETARETLDALEAIRNQVPADAES